MKIQWPYRRDLRPPSPESLGEHTDREFQKIEVAIQQLNDRIERLIVANGLVE